jgi:predicted transposase YdaD
MSDDYDSPWKEAILRYFPEFMAFYFPEAHAQIDWSAPHVFLEQELAQVTHDAQLGKRRLDKLVRVTQRAGPEQWVLIHVDVQGYYDRNFGERMFVYNYRIFDRYRRPVASLAVLADRGKRWRPNSFKYALFGCEVGIQYPVVKLTDFQGRLDELLSHDNVFALVTVAHLLTQQFRGKPVQRYAAKWQLARLLYERSWEKQRIVDLFAVIDWMLAVPPAMERELLANIRQLEKELEMPYMNPFEKLGRELGREEGRAEGIRQMLELQLERRFGPLPMDTCQRLEHANPTDLLRWGSAVLTAPSLDEVFH